jgi:hypothetical protein
MTTAEAVMALDELHPLAHLVRTEPGVRVEPIEPHFDHLAWATVGRLLRLPVLADLGDDQAVSYFRAAMRRVPSHLTFYVNPGILVTADSPTRAFLVSALQGKLAWQKRLRDIFCGVARTHRYFGLKGPARQTKSPELRQLEFHGVLVLDGKHIFPDRWPKLSRTRGRSAT